MKNLKELRLEKGLSQQQLADFLHITQQSVYKYENNISQPSLELLKAMADFFGTSVDYLIGHAVVPASQSSIALSPQESRHLFMYRQLRPEIKEAFDTLLSEYVRQNQK